MKPELINTLMFFYKIDTLPAKFISAKFYAKIEDDYIFMCRYSSRRLGTLLKQNMGNVYISLRFTDKTVIMNINKFKDVLDMSTNSTLN